MRDLKILVREVVGQYTLHTFCFRGGSPVLIKTVTWLTYSVVVSAQDAELSKVSDAAYRDLVVRTNISEN